jgi:two-component system sensor histidine kinase AtoS
MNYSKMTAITLYLCRKLNLQIDPKIPVYRLSLWQQYMVEFARILVMDPQLIILDEVSNKLTPDEMLPIYRMIEEKRQRGGSVIYITHNMDEILRLADRVTVLKDGYRRGTEIVKDLDKYRLFQLTYSYAINKKELGEDSKSFPAIRKHAQNLIQHLPIGVIILDLKDRIQLVNLAALEILKLGHESLSKTPLLKLFDGVNPSVLREMREKLGRREEGTWDEVSLGDGTLVKISVVPFKDDDFGFFGNTVLVQDVSVDHNLKSYLMRSEKMASVAELAVGVAHEINNPLYIIKNSFELIDREKLSGETREKLYDIEKEVNRIVNIVSSLLSFSRVRELPEKRINLAAVLEEVLLLLHHALSRKNIRVAKKLRDFEAEITGDENRLKQLFINLITNSIEAVLDEGTLEVVVTAEKEQRRAKVLICDNGYGIPADIQESIFKPFFSTKINKRNTGLGLSICSQIVKEHKGEISFKSVPGKKTSFCVQFPMV